MTTTFALAIVPATEAVGFCTSVKDPQCGYTVCYGRTVDQDGRTTGCKVGVPRAYDPCSDCCYGVRECDPDW